MPPTKRKSGYDRHDSFIASESGSPALTGPRPNKRAKASASAAPSTSMSKMQKDDNGDAYWAISTARRVTVSEFKGKKMVSVREYYEKDGSWLPGKKGITMTLEQYSELVKVLPQIEKALGKDGEKVGRPSYDGGDGVDQGVGDDVVDSGGEDEDENVKSEPEDEDEDGDYGDRSANGKRAKKANIEATSDEEED